ncbi:HK97 family phage prohead protease [Thalassovita autumnalis]
MMLERKFTRLNNSLSVEGEVTISGYASLFHQPDQGGDRVMPGAFAASLKQLAAEARAVKMLWQHDPAQPIGLWEEISEDARGLWVKGRLLPEVSRAREAQALIAAGAIDGLSIGYRTEKAVKNPTGGRALHQLDLWEVSLVTFPMLPSARLQPAALQEKAQNDARDWRDLTAALRNATELIRQPGA